MNALKFAFASGTISDHSIVSILNYIPLNLHKAIRDKTTTTELTSYINAAAADTSVGAIYFPNGKYLVRDATFLNTSTCTRIYSDGGAEIGLAAGAIGSTNAFVIQKDDFWVDGFKSVFAQTTDPVTGPNASAFVRHLGTDGSRLRITNCNHYGGRNFCYLDGEVDEVWITDNYIEATWSDSIDVISGVDVHISRNTINTGGWGTSPTAGAIRTAPATGGSRPSRNIVITDNIIRQFALFGQSAIDCYASGANNILISGNLVDQCGSGIEVKTDATALAPDQYQIIKISGNEFNCSLLATTYIAIALNSTTASLASGKAGKVMISDNHIVGDGASLGSANFYGISADVYFKTAIMSNYIHGVSRGITIAPTNSGNMDDLCVESNILNVVGSGIVLTQAGATFRRPHIVNNDVTSGGKALTILNAASTNPLVKGNHLYATADDACEFRNMTNGIVTGNTMISDTGVCILGQTVAITSTVFENNDLISAASNAMNLGIGTGIVIRDNRVDIPAASRTVVGAATYVANNNRRNVIVLGDPTATYAAAVGDVFPVQSPGQGQVKEYVCVVAGGVGAAGFNAVMNIVLGSGLAVQATDKTTAVTVNAIRGLITMNAANLNSDTVVSFTLNNSFVAAGDVVFIWHDNTGTAAGYVLQWAVNNANVGISVRNVTTGNLAEAIVLRFLVIKTPI